jgi:hypothetical protein
MKVVHLAEKVAVNIKLTEGVASKTVLMLTDVVISIDFHNINGNVRTA